MAKGVKLTWYNIAICLLVVSGASTYGSGLVVFTTSIGQLGFYLDFDLDFNLDFNLDRKSLITLRLCI